MQPQVVKTLHDAFKRSLDDPDYLKLLAQLDQPAWYRTGEDYAKWAAETFKAERATIERVGLLLK
jgi:tripartite-type tricarboxylate transporter receptor subunit TctC